MLVGPFTLASMSGKEAPKKKIREEGSFTEIMTLLSEITDTELRKDQADISATKESSGLVTETVETTDPQDTKDAVLMMLQDLIELIRKNCNKKEKDFLNLELSYDESQERVEQCEEMLTEARETLAEKGEIEKQLVDKLAQKEGELNLLREKCSQKDAELDILKEKLAGTEGEGQRESENSFLQEENRQLRLENKSLKEANKREQREKEDTLKDKKREESEKVETLEKVESLQMELNKKRHELLSSEDKFKKLNIVLEGFKDKIVLCDSLDKENSRLNQRFRQSEERRQADEVKISTLEEKLRNKENEYSKLKQDSRRILENLETKMEKVITAVNQPQGNSVSTKIPSQDPMVLKKGDTTIINNRRLTIIKKSMESPGLPSTSTPSPSSRLTITPLVQISSASPSGSKILAANTKLSHLISTNSLLVGENDPMSSFGSTLEESVPAQSLLTTVIQKYHNSRN